MKMRRIIRHFLRKKKPRRFVVVAGMFTLVMTLPPNVLYVSIPKAIFRYILRRMRKRRMRKQGCELL